MISKADDPILGAGKAYNVILKPGEITKLEFALNVTLVGTINGPLGHELLSRCGVFGRSGIKPIFITYEAISTMPSLSWLNFKPKTSGLKILQCELTSSSYMIRAILWTDHKTQQVSMALKTFAKSVDYMLGSGAFAKNKKKKNKRKSKPPEISISDL